VGGGDLSSITSALFSLANRTDDVEKLFSQFGHIIDCRLPNNSQ
jgi:hypothetical protein